MIPPFQFISGHKNTAAKQLPSVAASCGSHGSKVTQIQRGKSEGQAPFKRAALYSVIGRYPRRRKSLVLLLSAPLSAGHFQFRTLPHAPASVNAFSFRLEPLGEERPRPLRARDPRALGPRGADRPGLRQAAAEQLLKADVRLRRRHPDQRDARDDGEHALIMIML